MRNEDFDVLGFEFFSFLRVVASSYEFLRVFISFYEFLRVLASFCTLLRVFDKTAAVFNFCVF